MAQKHLMGTSVVVENTTNLSAVTTATDGDAVETKWYKDKSVFINVSVNTGAVTVNIEASHDGSTWFNLVSKTYTAVTGKDIYSYRDHFPFMRTTTTTQSTSTVTTTITARS